ncbi:nucleosome-remodeling factor subunit NURF301-like [Folsomia candida]|uniref:Uncharacterized protein n=1 Tax=Folsomia candida TaxID=158441 RepID=A0A226EGC8_FOLCA|nr:nucleosome-remodeling factor subunit NURF301-like [Folsomia candida]OXA56124.1 hypothetical protein Fcan01_09018 [Folsomia candida]
MDKTGVIVVLLFTCVTLLQAVTSSPQGRQGILEFPKQIATIIRNTIEESIDVVFPTPTQKTEPPPVQLSTKSPPPRRRRPTVKPTLPGDTKLGQYFVDNFIITDPPKSTEGLKTERTQTPRIPPTVGQPIYPVGPLSPDEVDEYVYLLGFQTTAKSTPRAPPETTPVPPLEQTFEPEEEDVETTTVASSSVEEGVDEEVTTTEDGDEVVATTSETVTEGGDEGEAGS